MPSSFTLMQLELSEMMENHQVFHTRGSHHAPLLSNEKSIDNC